MRKNELYKEWVIYACSQKSWPPFLPFTAIGKKKEGVILKIINTDGISIDKAMNKLKQKIDNLI